MLSNLTFPLELRHSEEILAIQPSNSSVINVEFETFLEISFHTQSLKTYFHPCKKLKPAILQVDRIQRLQATYYISTLNTLNFLFKFCVDSQSSNADDTVTKVVLTNLPIEILEVINSQREAFVGHIYNDSRISLSMVFQESIQDLYKEWNSFEKFSCAKACNSLELKCSVCDQVFIISQTTQNIQIKLLPTGLFDSVTIFTLCYITLIV
jgi:hypothetical protein